MLEHLVFTGMQKDVRPYVSAFDVGVLCSLGETLPLAPLEMMATGIPVVVSNVGGRPRSYVTGRQDFCSRSGIRRPWYAFSRRCSIPRNGRRLELQRPSLLQRTSRRNAWSKATRVHFRRSCATSDDTGFGAVAVSLAAGTPQEPVYPVDCKNDGCPGHRPYRRFPVAMFQASLKPRWWPATHPVNGKAWVRNELGNPELQGHVGSFAIIFSATSIYTSPCLGDDIVGEKLRGCLFCCRRTSHGSCGLRTRQQRSSGFISAGVPSCPTKYSSWRPEGGTGSKCVGYNRHSMDWMLRL